MINSSTTIERKYVLLRSVRDYIVPFDQWFHPVYAWNSYNGLIQDRVSPLARMLIIMLHADSVHLSLIEAEVNERFSFFLPFFLLFIRSNNEDFLYARFTVILLLGCIPRNTKHMYKKNLNNFNRLIIEAGWSKPRKG